ncbi:hypothetical protein BDV96DRAFT_596295 [Lophiotrema nucula]|uniref:Uncharacterized protein n=1 Tax=Lophiotrema nucula TaxID=690887 RepID=A0A6A5ZMZ8_9PLEO|nr:hypothetical protein BDV96DRAFT_596295 [Lophiotrema nucula]
MVSTRSKAAQTKLEDFTTQDGVLKGKTKKATTKTPVKSASKPEAKKRKSNTEEIEEAPTNKRSKKLSATPKPSEDVTESNVIIINRAPVLQLWSASVAHFVYPELSWDTCLSAGSAISTICAVAKGRSIGTVPDKDESDDKQKRREETKREQENLDFIEVMHFKLKLKDGLALVGSEKKGKPSGEDALKKKFGEQQYQQARTAFGEALQSWKDDEDELNKKAFGMYEQFRPTVSQGQKGWGRKGELKLATIKTTVEK